MSPYSEQILDWQILSKKKFRCSRNRTQDHSLKTSLLTTWPPLQPSKSELLANTDEDAHCYNSAQFWTLAQIQAVAFKREDWTKLYIWD